MIKCFNDGIFSSNTYVVWGEKNTSMIVDCGNPPDRVVDFVSKNGLLVKYIVLTHGHFDHVDYLGEYIKSFPNAKVICHADEVKILLSPYANVSAMGGFEKIYDYDYTTVKEGDMLCLDELNFQIINTPGHTVGSICLLCESEKIMLTGDTLFANGYGRTDLPYGSMKEMNMSLRRLLRMDKDITFYPGHGEKSKIELNY